MVLNSTEYSLERLSASESIYLFCFNIQPLHCGRNENPSFGHSIVGGG